MSARPRAALRLLLALVVAGTVLLPASAAAQPIEEIARWRERMLSGCGAPAEWDEYALALYEAGHYRESIGAFQRAIQLGVAAPDSASWHVARAYAQLGDGRQAFRWMARAVELGFRDRRAMREDPAFEPYRGDARFRELVDHVGGPGRGRARPGEAAAT